MKIIKKLSLLALIVVCVGTTQAQKSKKKVLETEMDSVSYVLGTKIGEFYSSQKDVTFTLEALLAGVEDAFKHQNLKISPAHGDSLMQNFEMKMRMAQQQKMDEEAAVNIAAGQKILEANRKLKDIHETASGLQYQIIKEGTGKQPIATDKVRVHYVGMLSDGTIFDSSRSRGQDITFGLNQVIRGWTEGLQLMKEGAVYKFWIPAHLGYGNQSQGNIPPGSLLIFEVELFEVNPSAQQ
ncbi:MAG: FKBP-type peptidyl-prolyl cis-trans isomerase [Bacteroidales bacterium]|jgi:FKBP-type peptidyl-prolyl cis-trans isomerase FklB|nr:FKBP-type peptidyl-prolyl cis-trans isomerase [Bacteroidales bacterium]